MQHRRSNYPSQRRSPWFYVAWGCGGCSCLAVIATLLGFMLLKKGTEGMNDMARKLQRQAEAELQVVNSKMVNSQGEHDITGMLVNISSKNIYSFAMIEFDLYDKSGKPLGSTSVETHNLQRGGIWDFKAPIDDPAVASYKFHGVTGFPDLSDDPNLSPATRQKAKEQNAEREAFLKDLMKRAQDESAKPTTP
ncbi:MAG: hypothetical protein JWN14_4947 [Chthonomonadales bacterium]|nr:hypothetical protein [Chthonomonadales bacterium]